MSKSILWKTVHGEALEVLSTLQSESFDSLVTDPPAGIGLMGMEWDNDKGGSREWITWLRSIMKECYRVLKPGAHGIVWAIPRTSHWTATALEEAGFHIRDVITHVFGGGFPKTMSLDKMIDRSRCIDMGEILSVTNWIRNRRDQLGMNNADLNRAAGVLAGANHWTASRGQAHIPPRERWCKLVKLLGPAPERIEKLIKPANAPGDNWNTRQVIGKYERGSGGLCGKRFMEPGKPGLITTSTNENAKKWAGWATRLKPASEHWILVQKHVSEPNVAMNVLKYGTGGINIDGCRVGDPRETTRHLKLVENRKDNRSDNVVPLVRNANGGGSTNDTRRFPSNFVMTKSAGPNCPVAAIDSQSGVKNGVSRFFKVFEDIVPFFYSSKATSSERGHGNIHPTVKPLALMRYLCRLITPPRGRVLDPFMGSGSTGVAALQEGFRFEGIERDKKYFAIAAKRISQALPASA